MSYRRRFEEFGVAWPSLDRPALPFSPTVRVADIVYVSGQIPEIGQEIAAIGQVGAEIDLATARNAARLCAANIVYWLDKELDGNLDRVVKFAKLTVYVNAAAGFAAYSEVGNGASEFLLHVFGERGEHARCSLGMAGLPANVPVEADAIVHVR
ncbi:MULTISPECIES: RidA family protein [unclassified Mesorhizobium]|uniref:RidA family protein n=1 Tax=unclassified Mesorhizobium TaxID=325217 RepID=UPI00333BB3F3